MPVETRILVDVALVLAIVALFFYVVVGTPGEGDE